MNSGRKCWRSASIALRLHQLELVVVVESRRSSMAASSADADVAGQDHHRVLEVHGAALAVGQPPVVQHLEQRVEHVRVRLLDLVEQDHAVGAPAHGLGELPAFVVADVARWSADQPADGVALHVLAHVDADHRPLVVEQELGERLRGFRLAHARGAEEQERADGAFWSSPSPARERRTALATAEERVVLADHALARRLSSMWRSFCISPSSILLTGMPVHLETMPAMSSSVTSSFRNEPFSCTRASSGAALLDLLLEVGQLAVLDLRGLAEIPLAARLLLLRPSAPPSATCLSRMRGDDLLFAQPLSAHHVALARMSSATSFLSSSSRAVLALSLSRLERLLLDLELQQASLDLVDLERHAVDLHLDLARRLVDQVDGLVGQEAIGDVAVATAPPPRPARSPGCGCRGGPRSAP